jgi:hypothetical protein
MAFSAQAIAPEVLLIARMGQSGPHDLSAVLSDLRLPLKYGFPTLQLMHAYEVRPAQRSTRRRSSFGCAAIRSPVVWRA